MPVYVYQCERCQLQFEKLQSFNADPVSECPDCSGPVHRVIQPVGVIFKGSGFYVTDNRSKSSTMPPAKRDGETSSEPKETAGDKPSVTEAKATETAKPAEKAG